MPPEDNISLKKNSAFNETLNELEFYINNDFKSLKSIDPRTTLLEYLRRNGYYGTKIGCGEGGCGACTVCIAEYDLNQNMIKYRSANACLLPLCSVNYKQVITIEGIGNPQTPHAIQERLALGHGSQCGFCTPGIVMSFYSLLKLNPTPSLVDIEESFDGNLCRCTGYRPIIDVARTFSSESSNNQCDSESCGNNNNCNAKTALVDFTQFKKYDPNADLPFPSELINKKLDKPLVINYSNQLSKTNDLLERVIWIEPTNLHELLHARSEFQHAKLIGGNTEIGVEMKFKSMDYKAFINVSNIQELKTVRLCENESNGQRYLKIGVNITLTELIESLKSLKSNKNKIKPHENSTLNAFLNNLKWFASTQIRNFATLAGNIVTGSPISDLNPIFIATNSCLNISSKSNGTRQVLMRKFFLGYRKTDLKDDEILLDINVPLPQSNLEIVRSYKQAKRKDDDIAITNACFRVKLTQDHKIIDLDISYGGMAATTIYLNAINEKTKNLLWSDTSTLKTIEELILESVKLPYSVPGGMPTYRRTLAISFFNRYWNQVIRDLSITNTNPPQNVFNLEEIERELTISKQDIGFESDKSKLQSHLSALKQTTGVAKYLDDIPKVLGELHAGLVLSTKSHAYIKNVDPSKALQLNGVYRYISYKDVPNHNLFGIITRDEEYFASKEVLFAGQIIGIIVADTRNLARKAAALVEIEYEVLNQILTIEDAIENDSFYTGFERSCGKGEINEKTFVIEDNLKGKEFIFEGTCRIGGQEHFYLETHGCLVVPKGEDNEFEVYSSTQNINEIQTDISYALGIPSNRIVCKVKRIGGGFGGKESRASNLAVCTAIAAHVTQRPIRCVLDRDIDMLISGTRHPFWGAYKLRITHDGYFKAYDLQMINNAGHSVDLSRSVMERAITHCDNVYNFPIMFVKGRLAKTNIASNTAFRGFGGPQGMMITEMMISEVADQLNLDPNEIRYKNMYKKDDITHFKAPIRDWYVPEMWSNLMKESNYLQLRKDTDSFNNENKWKKRGLAIIPTKFGISFGARFLNQAGALVHIYTDGSVLISHCGIEMGQGLHTKMTQIASNVLEVPADKIFISETSTDKVPNGSATAASVSSDINGMAIMNACLELKQRIQPYREKNPNGTIADWAFAAYFDRVNLSANGFYKTPDLSYDWETNTGILYFYFTSGVSISLVELDLLTGDHVTLRTDILMDIGNSINYSIDIGQIEGAFMQGVGWCVNEELLTLTGNGAAFTRGPGTYKIPSFRDIPVEFNVKILKDKEYNYLKTIQSSKGVGEPPLFLGSSVFFALRDAVNAARKVNNNKDPLLNFQSPCTPEILRLAISDDLVQKSNVLPKQIEDKDGKIKYEKLWAVRP